MAVYVDELRRIDGRLWCHMVADTDAELTSMQLNIGLHSSWQHNDHFDLSPWKRDLAIANGAIPATIRYLVSVRRRKRKNATI